ncbi:MAG: hypothetical protein VX519_10255 [Myxococcota bacterium]|nr:hypothetical protein [Myxococcota bacterium]
MSWMLLLLSNTALAAGGFSLPNPAEQIAQEGIRFSVRAVGESWSGPHVTRVYRNSVVTGGGALLVPLSRGFVLDLEATYKRVGGHEINAETEAKSGTASSFQLVPISAILEGRVPLAGGGEVFAGVGAAFAVFREEHSLSSIQTTSTQGTKAGTDFRVGARMETGLAMPSAAPVGRQLQSVEFEVFLGGRWHPRMMPKPVVVDGVKYRQGLNLSALRVGTGLAFRF